MSDKANFEQMSDTYSILYHVSSRVFYSFFSSEFNFYSFSSSEFITRRKSHPTKGCKLAQAMFAIRILSISKRRRLSLNQIRWLSSVDDNSNPTSLKKLIQPFVMKCHPDMAKQQGLPKTAQQVNLKAIQNLNSYVDGTISFAKGGQYPFSSYQSSGGLMEIEFVMAFTSIGSKAGNPTTSRRRVELQVPPPTMKLPKVSPHVQRQVVKLLRMADLEIPPLDISEEEEEVVEDNYDQPNRISETWMTGQVLRRGRSKTAWDRSRERFLSKLNWSKYDELYKEALHDANVHLMTKNMIR